MQAKIRSETDIAVQKLCKQKNFKDITLEFESKNNYLGEKKNLYKDVYMGKVHMIPKNAERRDSDWNVEMKLRNFEADSRKRMLWSPKILEDKTSEEKVTYKSFVDSENEKQEREAQCERLHKLEKKMLKKKQSVTGRTQMAKINLVDVMRFGLKTNPKFELTYLTNLPGMQPDVAVDVEKVRYVE